MRSTKIAIIGYGVVGKGMHNLFKDRFECVIYDPLLGIGTKEEVNKCHLAIVCVPTPSKKDGSCDISIVEEVCDWLKVRLILIKSTVPPGTTYALRKKYYEQRNDKFICFSPEYMGESSYFTPFWKYPDPSRAETHSFVIVGGPFAEEILQYFMKVMSVDTKYIACSATEAELVKYAENAFFATKVTFCNEFHDIAEKFGCDWGRLREMWLLDTRINPNHTLVFEDNRGYGGKCLPKDISAIIKASEAVGYEPTLLKSVVETNKKIRERKA